MTHARALVCSLTALSLGMPAAAAAQAVIGGEWRTDVADFARRIVDARLTPGVGIAVALDDAVAYAAGFGFADLTTGRHVSEDTPFYIASSTKALTATAAAVAASRGELDLAAPMLEYLPEARLPEGVAPDAVTVRDLIGLTHGISGNGPIVLRTAYTGEFTRAQLLDLLRYHEPTGEHGTFDYNNLGFNLLGLVLEAVYDESWKAVVRRLVLDPLGMTGTSAYRSRLDPDRLAEPHEIGPEGFARIPLYKEDANLHAAGGHFASARDLARFVAAHQSGGRWRGADVLPSAAVELTQRFYVAQDRTFGPYRRYGWGHGWDLGTYEGDTLVHRFGGFAGYRSHMSFMPRHGIGVVVLVNGDGPASDAADLLATYIYDRLLSKDELETRYAARLDSLRDRAAAAMRQSAEHRAERAARMAPLNHPLDAFAGTYESEALGRMVWRVVAGGLEMRIGILRSRAEVYDAAEDRLRIELGGSGVVASFDFADEGAPARAVRVAGFRFERTAGD